MFDRFHTLSLRAKLAVCVGLGVLALVLVQTLLSVWLLHRDTTQSVMDAQSALIDHVARDLDQKLELRRGALLLDAVVLGHRKILDDAAALDDHFMTRPVLRSMFDLMVVADRQGQLLYTTSPALRAKTQSLSIADRPYFQEVMRTDSAVISSPVLAKVTGRPAVTVAAPVHDDAGAIVGMVAGLVYLKEPNFLSALGDLRIGEHGYFSVATKGSQPLVVAHAEQHRVMQPAPVGANPYLRRALEQGFEGTVETLDVHGTPSIISYRSLTAVPWVLVSIYPTAEAYASSVRHRRELVAASVGMSLLAGMLIWLFARRLLRPLHRLQHAMLANRDRPDAAPVDLHTRSADLVALAGVYNDLMRHRGTAEAALQGSERRLRALTDNMPALVAYVDHTETYRVVNPQYLRVFGIEPADMLGRTVKQMMGDAQYARLREPIAAALRGTAQHFELDRAGVGGAMHLVVQYMPDFGPDGGVQGFHVMTLDMTERRRAEVALQESRRRLIDITDNLPALVAYIDRDERYRFANSRYRDWLGVDPQAMLGRHVSEAVSPAYFAVLQPRATAALAGEHVRFERTAVRDGQPAYYQTEFIPDADEGGVVQGFYALTIDITERRAAELAIASSQQQLMQLTNSIPAMVGYFDLQQVCQYANDTGLKSLGLTRADVPGITLREALGLHMYGQHELAVREVLAGRRARLEGKTPFAGREAHFQAHLMPDFGDGGVQRGFYLMTFDITALKEAQMRQQRSEQQLRAIADNLPVVISYVDKDERFRFVNATYGAWTGVEPQAVIGQTVAEAMGQSTYQAHCEQIRRGLAGERQAFDGELEACGVKRQLHTVYIPDVQSDGHVSGFFSLSTDVTESRAVERELSSLARFDTLTGLPNRLQFNERLPQALARARRNGLAIALMFLDVDHFKQINDSFGHAAGDAVLREFAHRLQRAVRETDTVARLAGDEFVAILEGLHSASEARTVSRKIIDAISRPFDVEGRLLSVTTSLGVVVHEEGDKTGNELLAEADAALYQAKQAGRNTYHLAQA